MEIIIIWIILGISIILLIIASGISLWIDKKRDNKYT